MFLKFLVFSVLLYGVLCNYYRLNYPTSYELPDGDKPKSLNVTINSASYRQFQIRIECYNYDSLKHFEVRLGQSTRFELRNGVQLDFIKCFNNATDNENYNYGLRRWFNSLPYFTTKYHDGYPLLIKLDEYADVNGDVLFNDFDFKKFDIVSFTNLSFASTTFLSHLYCESCLFENNGRIDFNDFGVGVTNTTWLLVTFNKLLNFNRDNLKKFKTLNLLDIVDFDLDDYNTFNVPGLFESFVNVTSLKIANSKEKIVLHEQVFLGLKSLHSITLENLKLDNIPKDLFKNLAELGSLILRSNNIKTLDPVTFEANNKLSYLVFSGNPLFSEPHDKLESFVLPGESISIELGNFTEHSFDFFDHLLNTQNVSHITYETFVIDKFNITNFNKVNTERNNYATISFNNVEPALGLELAKSFGDIIRTQYDLTDNNLDAIINTELKGDDICQDCTMIKRLFPYFLKQYENRPGFYFEAKRLFVEFKVPDSCKHFDELFEEEFVENCPANCACKFNKLLDKVRIDCNNKNLTEIPIIPYPAQFEKLHSMDLNFENNSISVLSLANQNVNVTQKLSTLNFKNNKIETVQIEEDILLKYVWAMHLCGNPAVTNSSSGYILLNLASGYKYFSNYYCNTDDLYPKIDDYIDEFKSSEFEGYLNGIKCNK